MEKGVFISVLEQDIQYLPTSSCRTGHRCCDCWAHSTKKKLSLSGGNLVHPKELLFRKKGKKRTYVPVKLLWIKYFSLVQYLQRNLQTDHFIFILKNSRSTGSCDVLWAFRSAISATFVWYCRMTGSISYKRNMEIWGFCTTAMIDFSRALLCSCGACAQPQPLWEIGLYSTMMTNITQRKASKKVDMQPDK